MPVFGFAVDYDAGGCDFVVALGENIEEAHAAVLTRFEGAAVTVEPVHIEDLLGDQYDCVAILSNQASVE